MKFIAFVILFLVACHFAVAQESHYHKGLRSQADNDKMGTVGVMGVSFEHYSDYKNANWAYKEAMKSGYTKAFGEYPAFQARAKLLHVGQQFTGKNTANDQAVAVVIRELANNYQGRLSRQQFRELRDTIEGMRSRISAETWRTALSNAVEQRRQDFAGEDRHARHPAVHSGLLQTRAARADICPHG